MTARERFAEWCATQGYSNVTWHDEDVVVEGINVGTVLAERDHHMHMLGDKWDIYLAAWSAAREEAVAAAEESISKRIVYLKESSDEEKKEYGYLRAKKEKWIDGRPCRGFRDGWTLFGFARNEMCIVYQELPAAIRSRLDAASRDGGV